MSRIDEIRKIADILERESVPEIVLSLADIRHLLAELDRCRKVVEAARTAFEAWQSDGELMPSLHGLFATLDEYEKGGG